MSLFRRRRDDAEVATPVLLAGPMGRAEVAQEAHVPEQEIVPCIRYAIRREPDVAIDTGCSKLGGSPDLPTGSAWPSVVRNGGEKALLQFFAQLDLSDVTAAAAADLGFPQAGLLSFFAATGPEDGAVLGPDSLVLYTPPDTLLHRMGLRMVPVATAQLHALGAWSWPGSYRDTSQDADLRARAPEHYEVTAHHRLGGQVDAGEEVVLLQIDSDPALELEWGPDGADGRLVWSVPAADLAARNWAAARFLVS